MLTVREFADQTQLQDSPLDLIEYLHKAFRAYVCA